MLVTTCPDCDTTFKLTVAILEKAGGQVRCGRCARIFDANSKLREQPETRTERLPTAASEQPEPAGEGALEFSAAAAAETSTGIRWFLRDDPPDDVADGAADDTADDTAVAEAQDVAEAAPPADTELAALTAAAEELAAASEELATTPGPVNPLESPGPSAPPATAADGGEQRPPAGWNQPDAAAEGDWREDSAPPARRRVWPWAAAAGLLSLTLAAQLIHAARSDLAALPGVGPVLMSVYAKLGRRLAPPVALEQYTTLDLTAVAEPVSAEYGWLIIETRVQNRGPKLQPFPHILVRLLDRWGATVAGRYFGPEEYLVTPRGDYSRMNVDSAFDAQFIIVDPGPSATGFELEFCTSVDDGFRCDSE